MRKLYQQGDVLLVKMGKPPKELGKRVDPIDGRYVLVRGEYTGYTHAFSNKGVQVFITSAGKQYVNVLASVDLVHGNGSQTGHQARTILPGWYEVDQVKEIDPFTEEIRSVED